MNSFKGIRFVVGGCITLITIDYAYTTYITNKILRNLQACRTLETRISRDTRRRSENESNLLVCQTLDARIKQDNNRLDEVESDLATWLDPYSARPTPSKIVLDDGNHPLGTMKLSWKG